MGFTYFDPDQGVYRTVTSDSQQVAVEGESVVVEAKEEEPEPVRPAGPELRPIAREAGGVGSYYALSEKAWFVPVLGGSWGLAALVLGLGFWRDAHGDPRRMAQREWASATRDAMARAEKAAAGGEVQAFFAAAREALQLQVSRKYGLKPEAVTSADLKGIDDVGIMELLKEADRLDYSGKLEDCGDLKVWAEKLRRGLEELAKVETRRAA